MKAEDFDRKFEDGEDVTEMLDLASAHCPGQEACRVHVDPSQRYPASSLDLHGSVPEPRRSTRKAPSSKCGSRWFRAETT